MEDKDNQNQGSGFWLGLVVGGLAAGAVVLLLDKDDKDNLKENLKSDLEKVWEKIILLRPERSPAPDGAGRSRGASEEQGEKNNQKAEVTVKDVKSDLGAEKVNIPQAVKPKSIKKFFKKAGRQLKV